MDHRRVACAFGQAVAVEPCAGKRRQRRIHLALRGGGARNRQALKGAFLPSLHLRLEQIGRARHGEQQNRSEEHTSELQSLMRSSYAVFCLKKKKKELKH